MSDQASWAKLRLEVLERIAPASLIVDAQNEILHLPESARRFLRFGAGASSANLLRLADPALRVTLRSALGRAAQPGAGAQEACVHMELDGAARNVTIRIEPLRDCDAGYLLVVFQEDDEAREPRSGPQTAEQSDPVRRRLEREIEHLNARLRETVEQHESSMEELKQAWRDTEAARRESELQKERLSALFTQAPAPICILRGPDYRVEFANGHMCKVWGTSAEAVHDKPVFEAVPGLQRTSLREVLDGLMRSGIPQVGKEVPAVLDRDGSGTLEKVYLNFNYAPVRGIDGRVDGVLVIAFDVSDEIKAREQMSALHEETQTASRAKDDFLAMLGHELRNPLAPLRNSLQLMRLRSPASPDAELLDVADRQAGNLTRIVDDLLEAARITQGKIELRIDRLNLSDAVRQAFATTRDFIASHRHRTELDLPEHPLFVDADPMRMEQIVVNLLNNAAKYTPAGGRIRIELRAIDDMAELRVIDNGIGIPEDLRPRLFQLFQQGPRQLSRKEGGLGVGLSVVRRLVELHGGGVEVTSEGLGKGSTFVVRLPLAIGDTTPSERPGLSGAEHDSQPATKTDALRILVVDDNRDAGETLLMLTETLGHQGRLAGGGLAGLELCAAWRPDVVFLDIGLPDIDGYAVAAKIRARQAGGPRPRLVAVTGYGQDKDREKTREAGFDHHLVKPADFEAIVTILSAVAALRAGDAR